MRVPPQKSEPRVWTLECLFEDVRTSTPFLLITLPPHRSRLKSPSNPQPKTYVSLSLSLHCKIIFSFIRLSTNFYLHTYIFHFQLGLLAAAKGPNRSYVGECHDTSLSLSLTLSMYVYIYTHILHIYNMCARARVYIRYLVVCTHATWSTFVLKRYIRSILLTFLWF